MKRALGYSIYYVGIVLTLYSFAMVVRTGGLWDFVLLPAYLLPIWWIAAGIGLRLGVRPSDFFGSLARVAGVTDPHLAEPDPQSPST